MSQNFPLLLTAVPLLFSAMLFSFRMIREPRSLWIGAFFLFFLMSLGFFLSLLIFRFSPQIQNRPLILIPLVLILGVLSVFILLFPFLLILVFFVQGIRILRREGLRPRNLLSLLFSLLLIVYIFLWPLNGYLLPSFQKHALLRSIGNACFGTLSFSAAYLLFLMAMYCLSALLNLFHPRKRRDLDYIVVLGAGIRGEAVTPLLASRIERGIRLLYENPRALLILSGGQGEGEDIPEGEAMRRYALSQGVDPGRILTEEKSLNTRQNLLFSRALMEGEKPKIAVVTTSYHVFRALLLARKCHIPCKGYGARTKWYFTLNALIREFLAYLSLSRKLHRKLILAALFLNILVNAAIYLFRSPLFLEFVRSLRA